MKPSYLVARYLKMQGYAIFPVNPKYETVLDLKCYASLAEIDQKMDIIDIFRRPEHVLPIVQEAISIKPAVIWMQLGIINEKAAIIAREAGMQVVMDRCIKIDHMNM